VTKMNELKTRRAVLRLIQYLGTESKEYKMAITIRTQLAKQSFGKLKLKHDYIYEDGDVFFCLASSVIDDEHQRKICMLLTGFHQTM
jgi:hypothetical protein